MAIGLSRQGEFRSWHSEGTLGIKLRAHTLTFYPILALPLCKAQFLSGSSSRSAIRQAHKLVLQANYAGAVRAVTEPGGGVSLAYEANDSRIYCMETTLGNTLTRLSFDEAAAANVLKGTLEWCLLDVKGRIKPEANVVKAFTLSAVAVNGAIVIGKPLAFHEVAIAADRHNVEVSLWGCDKPASARVSQS